MDAYTRHHYIPKFIVKNFKSSQYDVRIKTYVPKVYMLDLFNFSLSGYKNLEDAFSQNNLYDINTDGDKKALEKLLSKIENPMAQLLHTIIEANDILHITRVELEIIKKYMLIQQYRNRKNSIGYSNSPKDKNLLSKYNKQENENEIDFWKRELQTILNNSWDDVVSKVELVGVKRFAKEINIGFLMFFKTDKEFCLNDIGLVTERIPFTMIHKMEDDKWKQAVEIVAKELGMPIEDMQTSNMENQYIDNMMIMPISPKMFIANVSVIWKNELLKLNTLDTSCQLFSGILRNHLELPNCKFVNQEKIYADMKELQLPEGIAITMNKDLKNSP